ncbi:MAG: flagellar basal-body MS-ring/collar protein FliF [Verrucomicrobiota bacterium JB022]|nr:flagellar basal-body MS-ring/collar protein FliF [Verrucomicrobiota bacterium JB022]
MNNILQQFTQFWKELGTNQKVSVILSALFIVGVMGALLWWSGRPQMSLLYGELDNEDLSAIAKVVQDNGVKYELRGNSVYVPREALSQLRMDLASQGLPQGGGVGFEIFDRGNFGISDFVQRTNYMRAIQGELGRTITQINGIRSARVMIVQPESRLVVTPTGSKPTASVFVETGGKPLPLDAVNSIRFLVANAVEGLNVDDVAVVDNRGNVLSESLRTDEGLAEVSGQLKFRREIERYYGQKVETMLSPVVGVGGVVARVSVEVNTDSATRTEVIYDPESAVVRQETASENTNQSSESRPTQGAGVAANLPENAGGAPAGGNEAVSSNNESRKERSASYEINSTRVEVIQAPGTIQRLTAAVVVAQRLGEDGAPVVRTPEEISRLQRMVGNALGIAPDQRIEDLVTVQEMPFMVVDTGEEQSPGLIEMAFQYQEFIRNFLALGVAIVMFGIFLRLLQRQKTDFEVMTPVPTQAASSSEPRDVTPKLTPELLNELIQSKPQNVSLALKNWVSEGQNKA